MRRQHTEPIPSAGSRMTVVGLLITTLIVAIGCAPRMGTQQDLSAVVDATNLTTTVNAIADEPSRFVGRIVTVSGEVGDILGPRWFTVGGDEFGGEEVLVLGRSTLPGLVSTLADSGRVTNDIVQVTGMVRTFEEDALEREIGGGLDLDGDVFDGYDAYPVIVMTDLDLTPRVDVVPAVAVPVPAPVTSPIVDELIIIDAPARTSLIGRAVALMGATVQQVNGARSFWIGPDTGRRLLVVMDSASTSGSAHTMSMMPKSGQTVAVAGVLQPVPKDIARMPARWELTPLDIARLSVDSVFLSANRVMTMDGKKSRR